MPRPAEPDVRLNCDVCEQLARGVHGDACLHCLQAEKEATMQVRVRRAAKHACRAAAAAASNMGPYAVDPSRRVLGFLGSRPWTHTTDDTTTTQYPIRVPVLHEHDDHLGRAAGGRHLLLLQYVRTYGTWACIGCYWP